MVLDEVACTCASLSRYGYPVICTCTPFSLRQVQDEEQDEDSCTCQDSDICTCISFSSRQVSQVLDEATCSCTDPDICTCEVQEACCICTDPDICTCSLFPERQALEEANCSCTDPDICACTSSSASQSTEVASCTSSVPDDASSENSFALRLEQEVTEREEAEDCPAHSRVLATCALSAPDIVFSEMGQDVTAKRYVLSRALTPQYPHTSLLPPPSCIIPRVADFVLRMCAICR